MALVIRKFGQGEYAYWVRRVGERVIHTYLGSTKDPGVQAQVKLYRNRSKVPSSLHHLFWDTNPEKLNIKKHANYIIERILELGRLNAMYWAQQIYPSSLILDVSCRSRSVSEKSKNFWRLWLGEKISS
ncbi:MAG: hypothetical protein HY401_09995 [Elusimicrobia bacterium]|nr:hypothetical protein [Elusimicrobiota bacterium]